MYPPLAKLAHVEGVVILEAMIGTDDAVRDVRVLRSIQLLDEAAHRSSETVALHADAAETENR